jgi:hypothetical protein
MSKPMIYHRKILTEHIHSLGFQDIRKGVTLQRVTLWMLYAQNHSRPKVGNLLRPIYFRSSGTHRHMHFYPKAEKMMFAVPAKNFVVK